MLKNVTPNQRIELTRFSRRELILSRRSLRAPHARRYAEYTILLVGTMSKRIAIVFFGATLLVGCEYGIMAGYNVVGCATGSLACWCVSPDKKLWTKGACPDDWNYLVEHGLGSLPSLACKNPEDKQTYRVNDQKCPNGWVDVSQLDMSRRIAKLEANRDYVGMYKYHLALEKEDLIGAWLVLCRAADGAYSEAREKVARWHRSIHWADSKWWGESYKETLKSIGVGPDDRIAYVWLSLAISTDDPWSRSNRFTLQRDIKNLEGNMNQKDLKEAKKMVLGWKPGQCPSKEKPL